MTSPALLIEVEGDATITQDDNQSRSAPWYNVPAQAMVSVEHPFIVKNITKGIESMGGIIKIHQLVQEDRSKATASLYLRPEDRMSKPIFSTNVKTNNVLLQLTVPKRTGRKRKRGSIEPYQDEAQDHLSESTPTTGPKNARYLFGSLRDNPERYSITPVGSIEQTHRFRSMSDFVFSTTNNSFMKKMRDHILPFEYDKMKGFKFDLSKGVKENTELIPPPSFTHFSIPFNYSYRQNPSVKQSIDSSGKVTTINTQISPKLLTQLLQYDAEQIPNGPREDIVPLSSLDPKIQLLVKNIAELLDERPIWTRRGLSNHLRSHEWSSVGRLVYQYVGYMFRSGPWRDAVVKFGVDPRSDPKYRIYQTMTFQLFANDENGKPKKIEEGKKERGRTRQLKQYDNGSHIFDGIHVGLDGKTWQVCDITDPLLKPLLTTTNIRDECHIQVDGWYQNGTWSKARAIVRHKMLEIISGRGPPPDSDYARILAMPDILDRSTKHLTMFKRGKATAQEREMATIIRTMASGAARRGGEGYGMQGVEDEGDDDAEDVDDRVRQAVLELDAADQLGDEEDEEPFASSADEMQEEGSGDDIENDSEDDGDDD